MANSSVTYAALSACGSESSLLQGLLHAVGESLIIVNPAARILFCGTRAAQLLGEIPSRILGQPLAHLLPVHLADAVQPLVEVLGTGHLAPSWGDLDRLSCEMAFSIAPLHDATGNLSGAVCCLREYAPLPESLSPPRDSGLRTQTDINHQVRNSLAIISSLLEMEALHAPEGERNRLLVSQARIRSLALTHDLSLHHTHRAIPVGSLAAGVVEGVQALFGGRSEKIHLGGETEITLGSRRASYLGLVFTELAVHIMRCLHHPVALPSPAVTLSYRDQGLLIAFDDLATFSEMDSHQMDDLSRDIVIGLVERSLGGQIEFASITPLRARIWCPLENGAMPCPE